ncbi:MAG TPA: class II fructose-1,6-bisphosphate aldolase [Candidatus Scybalousia intestinigallinarum]|nr:class II fructose-1,6-bisphosphate aldolase [Candidatus Scybalousia intestinigallinarum]
MLVNSKEILLAAKKGHYAIPHFNINNLEWTKYILEEMEHLQKPVILGVSEGACKYMGGFDVIVGMVKGLLKDLNITIPVCLHVDHGTSFETCQKAIDAGFTSVMIDASRLPLEENIRLTKEVVDYAHSRGVTVEAEIGHIGGTEDNITNTSNNAHLDECITLVKETNIDSLAPALGSVHGLYKGEPNLDFKTMKEISEHLEVPLVLHGGTGIPEYQIKEAISCGINKININTELQIAWHDAVSKFIEENPNIYDPRKVIGSGEKAIKEKIEEKVNLFMNRLS